MRPIRMVLHSSSFRGADEVQLQAIALLRELAKHIGALEMIDTEPGALPYLHIEDDRSAQINDTDYRKSWK